MHIFKAESLKPQNKITKNIVAERCFLINQMNN